MKFHELDSAAILLPDLCHSVIHLRSPEALCHFTFSCYDSHSMCYGVRFEVKKQESSYDSLFKKF